MRRIMESLKGRMTRVLGTALAAMAMGVLMTMTQPVMAENAWTSDACSSITDQGQREALGCNDGGTSAPNVVLNIINAVLGLIGLLAVVMIIVGGVQFATSAGDPAKAAKAKNTIAFSIVGLVVALLAFAIVNFVNGIIAGTA